MQGLKLMVSVIFLFGTNLSTLTSTASNFNTVRNSYFNSTILSGSAKISNWDTANHFANVTGLKNITVINSLNKGFYINEKINSVMVFDLKTNVIFNQIKTGDRPTAIFYDLFDKIIITCNRSGKNISVINPLTEKLIANIGVGGIPETAISDNAGRLFVSVKNNNEIVVINLKGLYVEKHWSSLPGEGVSGLAFDQKAKRLFAACANQKLLLVFDAVNGEIVEELPIAAGCNTISFDAQKESVILTRDTVKCAGVKQKLFNNYGVKFMYGPQKITVNYFVDEVNHKLVSTPESAAL